MNGVFRMIKVTGAVVGLTALIVFGFVTTRMQDPNVQVRQRRSNSPASGSVLNTGDDLQGAINRAKKGDTIVLQAGATFTGPIILPDKGPGFSTDADYITIHTIDIGSAFDTDAGMSQINVDDAASLWIFFGIPSARMFGPYRFGNHLHRQQV